MIPKRRPFRSRCSMLLAALCLLICGEWLIRGTDGQKVMYEFVRYPFRKKPKLERQFKISLRRCEQEPDCSQQQGLDLLRCARICVAPSCYWELYGHDELELGEIDVRATSFKGCWAQHYNR